MKHTFKRITSVVLAAAMSISAFAITASAADTYHAYTHISGSGKAYSSVDSSSGVSVWVGGGKATLGNGASVDGKTVQLALFVNEDGKYYDITTAKSTVWGTNKAAAAIKPDDKGKMDDADVKDYLKVSKGKITAGKKASSSGVYVHAYAGYDKKVTSSGAHAIAVKVDVKQAAAMINVYTSSGKTTDKADQIKAVTAPINQEVVVYPKGQVKATAKDKFDDAHADNTYSISVDTKTVDYVSFALANSDGSAAGDYVKKVSGVSKATLDKGLYIKGLKLDSKGKPVKAKITISNDQSGKKMSFTATVDNSVIATTAFTYTTLKGTTSAGKASTDTIDISGKITLAHSSSGATDKPKVFLATAGTDLTDHIKAGKLSFKSDKKVAADAKVSAALNKDGKLEFKYNDKSKPGTYYALIGYNGNVKNGAPVGILVATIVVPETTNSSGGKIS